jgi:nitric oxide reductase subunit B
MKEQLSDDQTLSPWWRRSVALVFVCGMAVLVFMSVQAYRYAPPIPEEVVDSAGKIVFTGRDIEAGQQVFLRYALMQNGSIWGHGAYLGPDYSARYLHELSADVGNGVARQEFSKDLSALTNEQRLVIDARVAKLLKENRYDPASNRLTHPRCRKGFLRTADHGLERFLSAADDQYGAPEQVHSGP